MRVSFEGESEMKSKLRKKGLVPLMAVAISLGLLICPMTVRAEETGTSADATVTIAEEETPLVATPKESGTETSWWWMILLAAGLGITIEEYVRIKAIKGEDDEIV